MYQRDVFFDAGGKGGEIFVKIQLVLMNNHELRMPNDQGRIYRNEGRC
jgi:hypothetical protein